jgi:signal transduction histidine kinase
MTSNTLAWSETPSSKRILVVDDDADTRESLTELLTGEGYDVSSSPDGEVALQQLRRTPVDLILLDLHMPVMNGWRFRTLQRAEHGLGEIPVIALSGEKSAQAEAIDAACYIRKPCKVDELKLAVARVLLEQDRKRLAVRLREAERAAVLDTIALGMGHEINNPLTYVLAGLELLQVQMANLRPGTSRRNRLRTLDEMDVLIHDAKVGAEKVRAIVSGLRLLSRPRNALPHPVDLGNLVQSAVDLVWNEIRHRAQLKRSLRPSTFVEGDEGRLGQVFVNLIINAAQSIEPGSVDSNEIRVSVDVRDEWAVVEIGDTGGGIPPEVKARVFEPFFTTKDPGTGTGLGLAISRSIVEEHRGQIELEGAPGQGTVVRVVLPLRQAVVRKEIASPAPNVLPPSAGPARVLVVDDEPLVLAAVARALQRDHEVTLVGSASDALEALDAHRFDVILCDVMMANMTGVQLHAEIARRHGDDLAARMVFMTGGAFGSAIQAFRARMPNRWVEKPFRVRDLKGVIADVVRTSQRPPSTVDR